MKILTIISGVLAVAFFAGQLWFGQAYTMYNLCRCGCSRTWLQFADCPSSSVAARKFFLRNERTGDLSHQHEFCDPDYEGEYPILVYPSLGFVVLGAVLWNYQRNRGQMRPRIGAVNN